MSANLLKRLTKQVGGNSKLAASLLTKRGQMKDGKLTEKGKKRQKMGAKGRAIDRAKKRSPGEYKYNKKTNMATKK